jgi:hypothetical protein
MSYASMKLQAIAFAKEGMRVYDICAEFDHRVAPSTVQCWIAEARKGGVDIPKMPTTPLNFTKPPRPGQVLAKDEKVAPAWMTRAFSREEEERLRELAARNVGLTAIAAQMRRPYAMLADAMDRLGLSRARSA